MLLCFALRLYRLFCVSRCRSQASRHLSGSSQCSSPRSSSRRCFTSSGTHSLQRGVSPLFAAVLSPGTPRAELTTCLTTNSERIPLEALHLRLFFLVLPTFAVSLPPSSSVSAPAPAPLTDLRITAAGIWHNVVLCLMALAASQQGGALSRRLGSAVGAWEETGEGVLVVDVLSVRFCFLASLRGGPPTSTHALTPLRGLDRPRAVLPARAAPPPRRAHHPPRRPRARRAGARGALAAGAVARGAARGAGAGAGGRLVRADGVVRCGAGGTVRGGAPRGRGDRAVLSPSGGGGPRRPAPSMLHRPLHALPRPTHPPRMPRPARPPPPRAGSRSALRRRRVVRRGARLRADGRAREGAADEGGGGGG